MDTKELELSIEELQQRWDYLHYELGIVNLEVTEISLKGNCKHFFVNGLSMEIENDIVICIDNEDIIFQKMSLLMGFLVKNLKSIKLVPYDGWYQEILNFSDDRVVLIGIA